MRETEFNKKQVAKYLAWTFGIAYAIQFGVTFLYDKDPTAGRLVLAAMMFVPALGVVLSGAKLKDMGWKPQVKKNIRTILTAWFGPIILTAAGAALYFLVFPGHFDLSGKYVEAAAGTEALELMREQGIS